MIEQKNHLQKLMDKQRKKSEMYVHTVQKANKYKAESYSLFLEIARCREELMTARYLLVLLLKKTRGT